MLNLCGLPKKVPERNLYLEPFIADTAKEKDGTDRPLT